MAAAARVRTVLNDSSPVLRAVSEAVKNVRSPETRALVADLTATVNEQPALGLAAPQIGVNSRVFMMRTPRLMYVHPVYNTQADFFALINPVITARSAQQLLGPEGCLSQPGREVLVPRSTVVNVEYMTTRGDLRSQSFTGLPAVVVQHEIDHLDGVLMTDRALSDEEIEELETQGKDVAAMEERAYTRYTQALERDFVWAEGELDR